MLNFSVIIYLYITIKKMEEIKFNEKKEQNYEPKCVLITGGCGFIGSNIC